MRSNTSGLHRVEAGLAVFVLATVVLVGWTASGEAATSTPVLTIAPSPTGGALTDGGSVALSVGPNSRFSPHARIEVLECSAPGGALPIDDSTCDGNTVQLGSVLIAADGSFQVPSYTIYQLPNSDLGEQSNHAPVCNSSEECVLYVGQDQNDFSQPKLFSAPFTVHPGNPSAASPAPAGTGASGTGATSGVATGSGPSSSPGAAAPKASSSGGSSPAKGSGSSSRPPGTLAFTGLPDLPWLAGTGLALVIIGMVAIRYRREVPL
jgi:hypothetical protein